MSKESLQWLNNRTLIGFTSKRGNAWHFKAELQGDEPNHYELAVPVEDAVRRLFNFDVVRQPIFIKVPCDIVDDGFAGLDEQGLPYSIIEVPDRQAQVTSDTHEVLGLFKDGYQGHGYQAWLLDSVANLLDDDLGIGSAGLLKNRGQAWVSVEVPDSITTPEGVEFRPNLLACTSFDGSLATTFKRTVTNVVCDNTLAAGLGETGQTFRVKHTRNSGLRIGDAREALAIVHDIADSFAREVDRLCSWDVSPAEWRAHLDVTVPVPEDEGRSKTVATNKRSKLAELYFSDLRCAPWNGTAFGVLQAHNTWNHHFQSVRGGVHRGVRNQDNVLSGRFEQDDRQVLAKLALVTNRA